MIRWIEDFVVKFLELKDRFAEFFVATLKVFFLKKNPGFIQIYFNSDMKQSVNLILGQQK